MLILNDEIIKADRFPDNTSLLKGIEVNRFQNFIEWYYESDEELITLFYIASHVSNIGIGAYLNLYMPYVPNARMDRVKSSTEVFTLKYFADMLNSLSFNSVTVLDPHSHVCEALIDRIEILTPEDKIKSTIEKTKVDCVFFPDEGSMKRYSDYCKMPYSFGIKNRDWSTGKINNLTICNKDIVREKNVLIVDDICSKGGTFFYSAVELLKAGAKDIYLYVTHCENSILTGEFGSSKQNLLETGLIKKVFTTNSIFTKEHNNIEVYNVREYL